MFCRRWITEAWEMCSATCGGGTRHRDVYCAEVISGNLTKVSPGSSCYASQCAAVAVSSPSREQRR